MLRTLGTYIPTAPRHKGIPSKMDAGLMLPAVSWSCTFSLQAFCQKSMVSLVTVERDTIKCHCVERKRYSLFKNLDRVEVNGGFI